MGEVYRARDTRLQRVLLPLRFFPNRSLPTQIVLAGFNRKPAFSAP